MTIFVYANNYIMTNKQLLNYLEKPRTAREASAHFGVKTAIVRSRIISMKMNGLIREYEKKIQCPISHRRSFAYVKND